MPPTLTERPTAKEIETIYAAAELTLDPAVAVEAARLIAVRGSLRSALAWSPGENWTPADYVIRALSRVHGEAVDPAKRAARMRRDARSLEDAADLALAEHIEFESKALFQRMNGSGELALEYRRRADAGLRVYNRKDAEAFALKLRACEIEARVEGAAALMAVAAGRAA